MQSILYKAGLTAEQSFYKRRVCKCDLCGKVFTEKRSLSRHEKNAKVKKIVTNASLAYGQAEHFT